MPPPSRPRFQIHSRLGAGGMGEVLLADMEHDGLSRRVALKRIRADRSSNEDYVAQFEREAKIGRLLEHPNIVALLDYGWQDGSPYLALEYVDGHSASALSRVWKQRGGQLPIEVVVALARDLASAMSYAHGLRLPGQAIGGVIHRDLTPDNLLVSMDGVLKVGDFGIATLLGATRLTETGTCKGKPGFMAPEVLEGAETDTRSDLFSGAVTLFQLSCGIRPFQGSSDGQLVRAVLLAQAPRPSSLRPDLPAFLDRWISLSLAKRPEDRATSYRELFSLANAYLESHRIDGTKVLARCMRSAFSGGPAGEPLGPTASSTRTVGRPLPALRQWRLTAVAAAVVVAAAAGASFLRGAAWPPQATRPADERQGPPVASAEETDAEASAPRLAAGSSAAAGSKLAAGSAGAGASAGVAPRSSDAATNSALPGGSAGADASAHQPALSSSPPAGSTLPAGSAAHPPASSGSAASGSFAGSRNSLPTSDADEAKTAASESVARPHVRREAASSRLRTTRAESKRPGLLRIKVFPWAQVFVNGQFHGLTPLAPLRLNAGTHAVLLVNDEKKLRRSYRVDVPAGGETELKVVLE